MVTLSPATQLTLNFLRVIAAQLVLFGHCHILLFGLRARNQPYIEYIAVMIFFIISGFLISFSLVRKNFKITFKEYFFARFCRIYSGYIPAIIFVALVDFISINFSTYKHYKDFSIKTFLGNIFMLQDFPNCKVSTFGSAKPFWTLNIEWWLYMFFGWFVLRCICNKDFKKHIFVNLFVLSFFSLLPFYNEFDLSVLWLLGTLVCFIVIYMRHVTLNTLFLKIVTVLSICYFAFYAIKNHVAYDLKNYLLLFTSLLFLICLTERITVNVNAKTSRFMQFLADYSFTLYLTHYSLASLLYKYIGNIWALMIISNIVACLLAQFTEKKHKKLLKFLT